MISFIFACNPQDNTNPNSNRASELSDTPAKVISLSPHITELMFILEYEQQLVGTVDNSLWPATAREVPVVGSAFGVNTEALLALQPNLVIAWQNGTPKKTIHNLQTAGLIVEVLPTSTLSNLPEDWLKLAKILENTGKNTLKNHKIKKIRKQYQQALDNLKYQGKDKQPAVIVLSLEPYYVSGGVGLLHEALTHCGFENAYQHIQQPAIPVSTEQLLTLPNNTRWLFSAETSQAALQATQFYQLVNPQQIRILESSDLYRPTPSIINGLQELCNLRSE